MLAELEAEDEVLETLSDAELEVEEESAPVSSDLVFSDDGWAHLGTNEFGIETWALIDGDKIHVREFSITEELVDENRSLQVDTLNSRFGSDAYNLVGRVPLHVWQKHLAPAIVQNDRDYVRRWLSNPDHAAFRTRLCRL